MDTPSSKYTFRQTDKHIDIQIESEREREKYIYIYIYIEREREIYIDKFIDIHI